MTAADDLDAVWAEAATILAENLHSDDYTIERMVMVSDGRGGTKPATTPPTYEVVQVGKCTLYPAGGQGQEYVSGQRVTGQVEYLADMPVDTVLEDTDDITINGRLFTVAAVKREGHWITSVTAELEART